MSSKTELSLINHFVLSCLVVFNRIPQSLFLPFTTAIFIAFNQNKSKNRQTANAKKLTKAEDQNPPITTHKLTSD